VAEAITHPRALQGSWSEGVEGIDLPRNHLAEEFEALEFESGRNWIG
jgi:hypothetical protein